MSPFCELEGFPLRVQRLQVDGEIIADGGHSLAALYETGMVSGCRTCSSLGCLWVQRVIHKQHHHQQLKLKLLLNSKACEPGSITLRWGHWGGSGCLP